jgi:glycosyltransferase involved in cell wall biosynthesis
MKILLISPEYPPHNIGGGGIVVRDIAQALSSKGHEITAVAGYYPTNSCFEKVKMTRDKKIKIIWLPLIPTPRTSLQLKTVMAPNIFSVLKLMKILRSDFDAIHLHGFGHPLIDLAAFICTVMRKHYILTLHGFPQAPLESKSTVIRNLYSFYSSTLGKLTLSKAERITAVSCHVKNEAINHGVNPNNIVVIPNGLDISRYSNVKNSKKFREKYGINMSDYLIVGVGILHKRKGFQFLVKAAPLILKYYNNTKFVIIGRDGGYKNQLLRLARSLQISDKIVFTGFLGSEMKKKVQKEANIVVIPSLVEPFGLAALEAMALGKPIVATKTGGLGEILNHNTTGILVAPKKSKEIAKAIISILGNSYLQKKLSINAKREVFNFSWKRIIGEYLAVYSSVQKGMKKEWYNGVR